MKRTEEYYSSKYYNMHEHMCIEKKKEFITKKKIKKNKKNKKNHHLTPNNKK